MSCHVLPSQPPFPFPRSSPSGAKVSSTADEWSCSCSFSKTYQVLRFSGSQVLTSQMAHKKCPPNGITDGTSLALTSLSDPRPEKADDIEELPMEDMRDTELCIDLELRIDLVDLMAEPGIDMDRWSGFWWGSPRIMGNFRGIIRWSKSFRQWSTKYTGKKMKMFPWLSSTAQAGMSLFSQMDNCWVFLLPLRRGLTLPLICKKNVKKLWIDSPSFAARPWQPRVKESDPSSSSSFANFHLVATDKGPSVLALLPGLGGSCLWFTTTAYHSYTQYTAAIRNWRRMFP